MRIILRTLCGCERVFAENGILAPMAADIYVPLPKPVITSNDPLAPMTSTRRFSYWKQVDGDKIYLERHE